MQKFVKFISRSYNLDLKKPVYATPMDLIEIIKKDPFDLDALVTLSNHFYKLEQVKDEIAVLKSFDELCERSRELSNKELLKLIYAGKWLDMNSKKSWIKVDWVVSQREWESIEDLSVVYSFMPKESRFQKYLKEQFQQFLSPSNQELEPEHLNVYFTSYDNEIITKDQSDLCLNVKEKYKLFQLSDLFMTYSVRKNQSKQF